MKKTGKILVRAVWLVFMSAVALIMLFPLIYSVLGGFNTKTEFTSLSRILPIPTKWVMSNYIFAFSTSAIKPYIYENSVVYCYCIGNVNSGGICDGKI